MFSRTSFKHSQTQPKTPPVQSFSIKTEDDCMLEERLSQETSGANTQSGDLFCLKKSVRFLQLKLNGNWSAYLMELDQFSEVVMNVSSEIAWGDHQGQRMLPSQEEGWVASIKIGNQNWIGSFQPRKLEQCWNPGWRCRRQKRLRGHHQVGEANPLALQGHLFRQHESQPRQEPLHCGVHKVQVWDGENIHLNLSSDKGEFEQAEVQ